jgi:hypothetical protein
MDFPFRVSWSLQIGIAFLLFYVAVSKIVRVTIKIIGSALIHLDERIVLGDENPDVLREALISDERSAIAFSLLPSIDPFLPGSSLPIDVRPFCSPLRGN